MSRGPDDHKARYGLTRLSDMSKAEYKEVHLSDEKQKKSPHEYKRSWSRYKEQVQAELLKQVGPAYSVRKKRAVGTLNMTVNW